MNRNVTPKPIKASGARDAHGRILEPDVGALYVHMHRENGLAHRHYVVKPWQVRVLSVALSRPMLVLYAIGVVTFGWAFIRCPTAAIWSSACVASLATD